MSSIFSAISGHLTRSLVLGTLIPVVVFVITAVTLFAPLVPSQLPLLTPLRAMDKEWIPWTLVLVTLALTGLLYNLNIPLVRLFEGYPWKDTALGKRRIRRYQRRVERATAAKKRLIVLRAALTGTKQDETTKEVQQELSTVARLLNTSFPGKDLILPTRLGNVIRSFEEYPRQQYGMSTIPLWPRMASAVNKDYAAIIDDAKSAMDFAVNSSFLSSLLAAGLFATGLVRWKSTFVSATQTASWALLVTVFIILAYLMYLAAMSRAQEWGMTIKGAFDLYRRDLLKALGFERQFVSVMDEREFWKQLSRQIVFGDPVVGAPLPFKAPAKEGSGVWTWIEQLWK